MNDVTIIGAGPNGLAAGIVLARAGLSIEIIDAAPAPGGAARSISFDHDPSLRYDVGSAVHPFVPESEFFRQWRATDRVPYLTPEVSFAHPLDGGRAALAYQDLDKTSASLGRDGAVWASLFRRLSSQSRNTAALALSPAIRGWTHPPELATLGAHALRSAFLSSSLFRSSAAPALLAGVMAHANTAMPSLAASSVGLVLTAMAHGQGWPLPAGGAQSLVDAMTKDFLDHGGRLTLNQRITHISQLPTSGVLLFDTSLRDLVSIAGTELPPRYLRLLQSRKAGHGAFKMDLTTSEPIPWRNSDVRLSPTVHLGGVVGEIQAAENDVQHNRHPERPYVLLVQPTVIDPHRAPGKHLVWAYCHVPSGSTIDMTEAILSQIERFAPGFRDTIETLQVSTPRQLEAGNPNLIGGDIAGGSLNGLAFISRPHLGPQPWRTPNPDIYLCSSYIAPGPGVHAMGGYHAAHSILKHRFHLNMPHLEL